MEQRALLRETSTGAIELVWDGVFSRVEFNCSCISAIDLCKGMCCRSRSGYAVELEPDEYGKYQSREHPTQPNTRILSTKPDGSTCVYHDTDSGLCGIHSDRPKMCRQWHCSTKGQMDDTEIIRRDAGWLLTPIRKEEIELVQIQLGGK